MSESPFHDVQPGRLPAAAYAQRLQAAETPALTPMQAVIEAERCLYCFDAPCQTACPTGIDVPSFIHRIADGNVRGAAQAILSANPLGGMCARVCPTEELCEAVCVRQTQQGKAVEIGRLQRYAVDAVMQEGASPVFTRAPDTGRKVAVVGAGPAGLACAHTLAVEGHAVTLIDAHDKLGGLNEYGLASYKTAGDFAQREIAWLLSVGGITVQTGVRVETAVQLQALSDTHDAVFLGVGLGGVRQLGLAGEDKLAGVEDAVAFIARLRQSPDWATLPIGRRVLVIGGGMTAVDAAVQAKLLGAEEVSIVYRRGPEAMSASKVEQAWAQTNGVTIRHGLAPETLLGESGAVCGVRFACQQDLGDGRWGPSGEHVTLPADMVLKAIGQQLEEAPWTTSGLFLRDGRIVVDAQGRTSMPGVWAGGDACTGGRDLTVEAVEAGKQAALSIHASFQAES